MLRNTKIFNLQYSKRIAQEVTEFYATSKINVT